MVDFAEFKIKDTEAWQQAVVANQDGYGKAVLTFAARWAHLMEGLVAKGLTIPEIAKRLSHDADLEGITGFQYGCAVSILSGVWEHGEELRKWHNIEVQVGDEGERANKSGGVLNPALMIIEKR